MTQHRDTRKSLTLAANEIAIDNFQFSPTPLTVKAGTKVTWINTDATPGTYDYFCALHPKMQGKVVVTRA